MLAAAPALPYRARTMKRNIVIYQDEGVGEFGVTCLEKFFADDDVWLSNAEAIIDGRVLGMADIFIMPGGADLPYCKKLNGVGNDNIRGYVEDGGTYLGICAGAYYACRGIEFHKGREDEICGFRELAFTTAIAYGSLPDIAPYYDLTLESAALADIQLADGTQTHAFYHGGPAFRIGNDNVEVLGTYAHSAEPAILSKKVGEGRVILSGVHFEVDAESLTNHPEDPERGARMAQSLKPAIDWKSFLMEQTES